VEKFYTFGTYSKMAAFNFNISGAKSFSLRAELKNKDEERLKFFAVFGRYGSKTDWNGYAETTLLLTNICFEDGSAAADHVWVTETSQCKKLGPFQPGQKLAFEARIGSYEKGYKYRGLALTPVKTDFKLNRLTRIRKLP
jgi:hypothetical protein